MNFSLCEFNVTYAPSLTVNLGGYKNNNYAMNRGRIPDTRSNDNAPLPQSPLGAQFSMPSMEKIGGAIEIISSLFTVIEKIVALVKSSRTLTSKEESVITTHLLYGTQNFAGQYASGDTTISSQILEQNLPRELGQFSEKSGIETIMNTPLEG